ncbi:MAG: potassium channel family protein [Dehalococcoidales bacterium]|nr:potassium channel family protein [Dehalococcoidales bacterium]
MGKKPDNSRDAASRREELLQRFEHFTELPLIVLAFIMIPLLVGPFIWDLTPKNESTFLILDYFIWAIFAIDLIIKVVISTHRVAYLKKHWLDVLVVIVPFFRPLRILRVFLFATRSWVGMRRLVKIDFLLVYGIGLVIIAATVVATVERGPDATINGFADALWWAVVTITTVGYGDEVPVTLAGKAVAFVLMLGGIALFSGVTANLASYMLKDKNKDNNDIADLVREIKSLKEEVSRLRAGPAES